MSDVERFWAKVDKSGDCWIWTACRSRGYGCVHFAGRQQKAHRVAYELMIGPIPDGLQLDHLCRVRHCVNPAHLEPVTARTNVLRGQGLAAVNAARTHCPHGHPYDAENTYRDPKGCRHCRKCLAAADKRWQPEPSEAS